MPEDSKTSRYTQLKRVEKQSGVTPEGLIPPQFPPEAALLWEIFLTIRSLSPTEIKAYCDLTGETLSKWEVDAMMNLDTIRAKYR